MTCSFSWKNIVVVVIAVLIQQITNSNGEKGKCGFEKFKEDQGNDCCFYEPECTSVTTTQPSYIDVWKPYEQTIWKTRNFTRPIEECEVGKNETVCFPFKKNVCKSRILPGTCATVSYKKPATCINRCPNEYILYDPDIHKELYTPAADGPGRRTKRALGGHEIPHGHPGFPAPAIAQPCTPGQPGCGVIGCVEGDVGCTAPGGGHHVKPDDTIAPIPIGCFEVCQYESYENCCDFPDKICEEVWLHKCETGPQISCTWVDHQTCSIYQEKITKYEKITVQGPDEVIKVLDCTPNYWCKVCEGEPDLRCYKNQEDFPTTHVQK